MSQPISSDISNYNTDGIKPLTTPDSAVTSVTGEKGVLLAHSAEVIDPTALKSAAETSEVGQQALSTLSNFDRDEDYFSGPINQKNFLNMDATVRSPADLFLEAVYGISPLSTIDGQSVEIDNKAIFRLIIEGLNVYFQDGQGLDIMDDDKENLVCFADKHTGQPILSEQIKQELDSKGIKTFQKQDEEGHFVTVTPLVISDQDYHAILSHVKDFITTYMNQYANADHSNEKTEENKNQSDITNHQIQSHPKNTSKADSTPRPIVLIEQGFVKIPSLIAHAYMMRAILANAKAQKEKLEELIKEKKEENKVIDRESIRDQSLKAEIRKRQKEERTVGKGMQVPVTDIAVSKYRKDKTT